MHEMLFISVSDPGPDSVSGLDSVGSSVGSEMGSIRSDVGSDVGSGSASGSGLVCGDSEIDIDSDNSGRPVSSGPSSPLSYTERRESIISARRQ